MLRAAAARFDLSANVGDVSGNVTKAATEAVYGAVGTTVLLLQGDDAAACLITPNLTFISPPFSRAVRKTAGDILSINPENVLLMYSHNHCCVMPLSKDRIDWTVEGTLKEGEALTLTKFGEQFMRSLCSAAGTLRGRLEPVSVHWGVGHERRISYRRKGHRADGTTYFVREEDRKLLGADFCGDIDDDASVVRLVGRSGRTVAWITHFSAHPVTAYHPEHPCIHPEYPGIAGNVLSGEEGAPVSFLQGCCGDVNTKYMLMGEVERADQHGRWLGETFRETARAITPSGTDRLGLLHASGAIPLAPLPSVEELLAEKAEMEDFVRRACAGDENTLSCVGLNFPRALSPAYRAGMVEAPLSWNAWALDHHRNGTAGDMPDKLNADVCVLRLGDVGIVGMPCEPFTAIGRKIRERSPMAMTLPCGYCNVSYGYVPDSGNVGGREYMSAFYRYTRRPPFRAPAGDVLADAAVEALARLRRD